MHSATERMRTRKAAPAPSTMYISVDDRTAEAVEGEQTLIHSQYLRLENRLQVSLVCQLRKCGKAAL